MHFYPHNIADFNNATRHLTRVERSVYRDAIERYYDTEEPLNGENFDRLARLLLCVSDEEKAALKLVLEDHFTLIDGNYHHDRCDREIEKYRLNTSAKAKAGRASAEARKNKRKSTVQRVLNSVEQTNNQETLTTKQETVTNKDITPTAPPATPKKNHLDYSCWPNEPSSQVLTDWMAMRKRLKANVSQTVINRFASELHKAATYGYTVDQCISECVARNWRGFEVQWILNSKQPTGGNNGSQPKPSLIDRFITNNYPSAQDDYGSMGGNDRVIRGEVVEPVRGSAGQVGPMDTDLIGDFKETGGGGFE